MLYYFSTLFIFLIGLFSYNIIIDHRKKKIKALISTIYKNSLFIRTYATPHCSTTSHYKLTNTDIYFINSNYCLHIYLRAVNSNSRESIIIKDIPYNQLIANLANIIETEYLCYKSPYLSIRSEVIKNSELFEQLYL